MPFLPPSTISSLHAASVALGLHDSRQGLLSGIPQPIAANLSAQASSRAEQLLLDLNALNQLPNPSPLHTWLDNAIRLHGHDPRAQPFIDAQSSISAAPLSALSRSSAPSPFRMPLAITAVLSVPIAVLAFQFCMSSPHPAQPSNPSTSSAAASSSLSPTPSAPASSPSAATASSEPQRASSGPSPSPAAETPAAQTPSSSVQINNDVRNIQNQGTLEAGNIEATSKPGSSLSIDNKVNGVSVAPSSSAKVGNIVVK